MITTVPTGDIGFDVILGGGWRLVERLQGRRSASIVLRGGPGTGKTLLSVDVALALATALDGDVVVACVELLPSEYLAQIEAGRAELVSENRGGPRRADLRVVALPQESPISSNGSPTIFCGLLPELSESDVPDLVAALESLLTEVTKLNGKPRAVVVDSLIAGYGLGPSAPRQNVDAVMKFVAERGYGLVLCEEASDDTTTAWDFAADTLLVLDHDREGERHVLVRKHRYGASDTGAHQLEIGGWRQPQVYPRATAWLDGNRNRPTLEAHGWRFASGAPRIPMLRWVEDQRDLFPSPLRYRSALALVSGPNLQRTRRFAFGLVPDEGSVSRPDILIHLNPLGFESDGWSSEHVNVRSVPIAAGIQSAICGLVEYLGGHLFRQQVSERPRRIVIGDIGTVAGFRDQESWAAGIGVIATLVAQSGWGIPVIVYGSDSPQPTRADVFAKLRWQAELVIEVSPVYRELWDITSRSDGSIVQFQWPEAGNSTWPKEIEHLASLPGSRQVM